MNHITQHGQAVNSLKKNYKNRWMNWLTSGMKLFTTARQVWIHRLFA